MALTQYRRIGRISWSMTDQQRAWYALIEGYAIGSVFSTDLAGSPGAEAFLLGESVIELYTAPVSAPVSGGSGASVQAGGVASPISLALASGATANGQLGFPAQTFATTVTPGSNQLTNCTNLALLTAMAAQAPLTLQVAGSGLPPQALVSAVTPGTGANGIVTLNQTCSGAGGSATITVGPLPITSAAAAPYLVFPSVSLAPVTDYPTFRLYLRNLSGVSAIQPTLLLPNGLPYNGNGGSLPVLEPGGTLPLPLSTWIGGQTSRGVLNVSVPGVPPRSLRLALQNLQQGDTTGFSVVASAWMT